MTVPLLSVVIPARNERRLIAQTLDHVLESSRRLNEPVEVIVVDNDSSDGTKEILHEYSAASAVRVFRLDRLGAARARNFGRRQASGRILAFVDADTRIPSDSLSRVVEHCDHHGKQAGITRLDGTDGGWRSRAWWSFWEHVRRLPLSRAKAMPAFMFCTADVFDEFGPFDEEVAIGEEWPILATVYRLRPTRFIYDRSITALTSDRRMCQQPLGYTRTLMKYVWAIMHRSGRIHYSDQIR